MFCAWVHAFDIQRDSASCAEVQAVAGGKLCWARVHASARAYRLTKCERERLFYCICNLSNVDMEALSFVHAQVKALEAADAARKREAQRAAERAQQRAQLEAQKAERTKRAHDARVRTLCSLLISLPRRVHAREHTSWRAQCIGDVCPCRLLPLVAPAQQCCCWAAMRHADLL